MAFNNVNQRLDGFNPLAYMGVNASQPPQFVTDSRAPTMNDIQNFQLGSIWLNRGVNYSVPPTASDIWMLVAQIAGNATWVNFAGAIVTIETLTGNTGGAVGPDGSNNINVVGDAVGITIAGNPGTHTLTASLVGGGVAAQSFPTDSGTATPNASGVLNVLTQNATNLAGATTLFSGSGNTIQYNNTDANGNVTIGKGAGKLALIGSRNTALGQNSLHAITSGSDNTAIGFAALNVLTTSSDNTAVGSAALLNLTTGTNNIAIGFDAGDAFTTTESNNIIIGNLGVIADSATTRIGTHGTQTKCFISGIDGVNVGSTAKVVTEGTGGTVDQLGTAVITAGSGITVTPGANTITIAATSSGTSGSSIWSTGRLGNLSDTGGIRYANIYMSTVTAVAAIGDGQTAIPMAGTVDRLYVILDSAAASTTNDTITLNINGVATALTVTTTALTPGVYSNLVNSVSVSQGDLATFQLSQATTGNNIGVISCRFTAS